MLAGTMNFRDAVRIMWDNVNLSWEEAMDLLNGTTSNLFLADNCLL